MGCQQSKQHHAAAQKALTIEAKPTTTQYGIECSTGESDYPVVQPEETPQEIRTIRAELFSKDSILAMASSGTVSTSYTRSFGSYSSQSQESTHRDVGENDGCRFIGGFHQYHQEVSGNESQRLQQPQQRKETSGSRRESFDSCKYQYPKALYDEMQSQKHFVPTTSTTSKRQHSRTSLPSLPSGDTSMSGEEYEDDEGSASLLSSYGGGDESSQLEMFPQFEALVDTMALSLSPQGNGRKSESYLQPSVLSLGALVDKLTEMEDGDDFNHDEEEDASAMMTVFAEGDEDQGDSDGSSSDPTVAPTSNSRTSRAHPITARTSRRSRSHRHSAPPALEQLESSEMLASIKTLAFLADGVRDIKPPSSTRNIRRKSMDADAAGDDDEVGTMGYCSGNIQSLKYHRSTSVAPPSSASVCSELRWM